MGQNELPIRDISDTARWAAVYRAREGQRPDALFRDPFAGRLAGERGEQIAALMPFGTRQLWAWATRTYLFDQFIQEQIQQGADMVISLGAGLDARPYRMPLPSSLQWIEVDLPQILAYKQDVLAGEDPACALRRIPLDLSDIRGRREVFQRCGGEARKVVIVAEALLPYLTQEEVASVARDLAGIPSFRHWITDVVSPRLLCMFQKKTAQLRQAGAAMQFAPMPEFFLQYGWKPVDVRSMLKTAARLKRLPFFMRLVSLLLSDSPGHKGERPWYAVCLLAKE